MVKEIIVKKIYSDEDISKKEGDWFGEECLSLPVINSNVDVYYYENGQKKLLLKFRKKKITDKNCELGWDNYKDLAKASRGRGASAGAIDPESVYWKKRSLRNTNKWSTGYLKPDGGISKMKVNNQVASNPIGFYESTNNLGSSLPCRLTHFTRTNYDNFNNGLRFIQNINNAFKGLIPLAYQRQLMKASLKNHLRVPKTCFSTITINRNFRTALHRDRGDYKEGFGNLTVLERGKYRGGYTMFPQFGVGVDVRHGDFIAMDVHQWHCNSEIYETEEDKLYNESLPRVFKDNPEVGTIGLDKRFTRLTFVCYLREKISNCPNKIDSRFLTASGHSKII
jgi:hypothetical protein